MVAATKRVGLTVLVLAGLALGGVGSARGAAGSQHPPPAPPRIGPETPVGSPVMGVAPDQQSEPAIAAGEGGFLSVWTDGRQCCSDRIFGSRLDRDGTVLDPSGILIGTEDGFSQGEPRVTWAGSHYLVVWEDISTGIRAARVTTEGEVLDEPSISVADFENFGGLASDPDVSSSGDRSLVVWSGCVDDWPCNINVFAAFVERDGTVTDPFELVDAPLRQAAPRIAGSEDGFLVAWHSGRGNGAVSYIQTIAVDRRGVPRGTAQTVADTLDQSPLIAFSSGVYLVVWEQRVRDDGEVHGTRVTPGGEVMDSSPIRIASGEVNRFSAALSADADGGWAVVLVGPKYGQYGSHVDSAGGVANPGGVPLVVRGEGDQVYPQPAVAFNGAHATLVWTRFLGAGFGDDYDREDIYAVSGDFDELQSSEQRLLTGAPNTQSAASIAWNGEVFLVAWWDERGDRAAPAVYATRVTPSGEVLDGAGIRVSPEGVSGAWPAVSSDGTDFLVAWQRAGHDADDSIAIYSDVYATRMSAAGDILDEAPIPVSTAPRSQFAIAATWTGTSYLLAWQDARTEDELRSDRYSAHDGYDIYGARVSAAGEVLDPDGIPLREKRRPEVTPDVDAGGDGAFLTWTRGCRREDLPCTDDVLGLRLSESGQRIGGPLKVGTSEDLSEWPPSVSVTDRGWLVAWSRRSQDGAAIAAREISYDGSLGDTRVLSSSPTESRFAPQLDWAGGFGTIAWNIDGPCPTCGGDVVATRVSASGDPLDEQPTPVASAEGGEAVGDMASTGLGCTAIVYERADEVTLGVSRSFLRLFGDC